MRRDAVCDEANQDGSEPDRAGQHRPESAQEIARPFCGSGHLRILIGILEFDEVGPIGPWRARRGICARRHSAQETKGIGGWLRQLARREPGIRRAGRQGSGIRCPERRSAFPEERCQRLGHLRRLLEPMGSVLGHHLGHQGRQLRRHLSAHFVEQRRVRRLMSLESGVRRR